jgi:hypothetical protein
MPTRSVEEAGSRVISDEDQACLLKCVEHLLEERDGCRREIERLRHKDAAAEEHF